MLLTVAAWVPKKLLCSISNWCCNVHASLFLQKVLLRYGFGAQHVPTMTVMAPRHAQGVPETTEEDAKGNTRTGCKWR